MASSCRCIMGSLSENDLDKIADRVDKMLEKRLSDFKRVYDDRFNSAEQRLWELEGRITYLMEANNNMKIALDRQEAQDRRNNVIITGIAEIRGGGSWEDEERKVKSFFKNDLRIEHEIRVERAHRLGPCKDGVTRRIIVKLLSFKDRESILRNRVHLKGTNYYVNEDFTARVREIRGSLWRAGRNNGFPSDSIKLKYDKMTIGKSWYVLSNDGTFALCVSGPGRNLMINPPRFGEGQSSGSHTSTAEPRTSGIWMSRPSHQPSSSQDPATDNRSGQSRAQEKNGVAADGDDRTPPSKVGRADHGRMGPPRITAVKRNAGKPRNSSQVRSTRAASKARAIRAASKKRTHNSMSVIASQSESEVDGRDGSGTDDPEEPFELAPSQPGSLTPSNHEKQC